ncbi:hypothetical protein Enr10x_19710 [Gimesia panareensis]|uniref:Uncharacterized protein n=1 Tax=Gimesia panareensis TaxID=2527978 RepID=A0A517Q4W8_9PLAN|nr:hypothetical protein [Gimesia panareensis]QDT26661.1 hypothetical protein Enr10x_19710 [Gimesia panareensis]
MQKVSLVTKSKRAAVTKVEFLVIIFIIIILIALLYPAIQPPNSDGPLGKLIPVTAPDEKNRVTHTSGISFIPPPDWVQIRDLGPDNPWLRITPRGSRKGRDRAVLMIGRVGDYNQEDRLPDQTELKQFKQFQFQGYPAYERVIHVREPAFDNADVTLYDQYHDRDGEWWHVSYSVVEDLDELPEMMREYINAIRFPPKVDQVKELSNNPETKEE